ncbi:MAG: ankyrin repeat domain-containing protein [Rubrobacteraceae bacterium]
MTRILVAVAPVKALQRVRVLLLIGLVGLTAACGAESGTGERSNGAENVEARESKTTVTVASRDDGAGLIPASGRGDARAVERLLERGADVNARDGSGATPLMAAARENRLDVARRLIEAGANVDAQDDAGQNAYLIVTAEGYLEFLRLLIQNGVDLSITDNEGGTGLIHAADAGRVDIVRILLDAGVDVNRVNTYGWTALLEAIILGDGGPRYTEIVRLLVEAGADVNIADSEGVTPLEHARQGGYEEIAGILREAGAR